MRFDILDVAVVLGEQIDNKWFGSYSDLVD